MTADEKGRDRLFEALLRVCRRLVVRDPAGAGAALGFLRHAGVADAEQLVEGWRGDAWEDARRWTGGFGARP